MIESICIEINRECCLKCKHCSAKAGNKYKERVSLNDFSDLLKNINLKKGGIVFLSGGEPLLHPELIEFIKEIRKNGYYSFLYSSGVMIKEGVLKSVNKNYFNSLVDNGLKGIAFSLYSLRKEFHDYVTGVQGSLNKLLETIENLNNINIRKEINFLPLKSNYQEVLDIIKFMENNGFSKLNILKLIYQGRAKYGFYNIESLSKKEEKEFLEILNDNINTSIEIEISKLYDCDNYKTLLKSPFSAGINELFITSKLEVLNGRKYREYGGY